MIIAFFQVIYILKLILIFKDYYQRRPKEHKGRTTKI